VVERDGPGWKHQLVLYTRHVKPPGEGVVFASNPNTQGRVAEARFVRDDVWKMSPSTPKRRRVVGSLSRGITDGQSPSVYAFGGDRSEPIPLDVIELSAFNERFLRD